MKYLMTLLILLAVSGSCLAQDALPFGVTVGGQKAVMTEKTTNFACIEKPVAGSAAIGVEGIQGQVIANAFPSDEMGVVANGVQPLILLFDAGSTKALTANMQSTPVKPGWYAMNVVGGGGTSRILFQVK